ncbi:hypothetical protein C8F04DRAFT_76899 [Mycena alexandri]|uniref:Uncharacterized protein n=1 Tax=Mycena alexandri TaxID=1745969 RepID=A0AAD6TBL3_9AGAR|nr:hypothetical protein C8F04DRAFT_76899 [Mycena alexandri]
MSALDTTETSPQHKPPRRSRHPSTASIRSTASTKSPRPTVWRPPNHLRIRKDSLSSAPDARLSVVVVGAEISGTIGNVRDRMEAFNITVPVAGPSSPAPSASSDLPHEIAAIPEVDSDEVSFATLGESGDDKPVDGPNLVTFPVSVSPPASRASSWFGSISRAKGKEKLAEVQAVAAASTPNLLAPASSIPIPVPDATPSPSASEPVTSLNTGSPERPDPFLLAFDAQSSAAQRAASAAKRSWFSSSPVQPSPLRTTSPPQRIPHPIHIPPEAAALEDKAGVPSSIDSFPIGGA